jgi:hypothetical protein
VAKSVIMFLLNHGHIHDNSNQNLLLIYGAGISSL